MIIRKSPRELEIMREAGRIVARAHEAVRQAVAPGVTTAELNALVEEVIRRAGAVPTFLGYHGFPASICASPNDVVVHGIPGDEPLREGDILSVDIGATFQGYVGDAAYTWPVGRVSDQAEALLRATEESLHKGIAQARVGNRLSDISHAVQAHVEAAGFSVVRDYAGHGVGQAMHEGPQIPNYGPPGRGPRLQEGMVLAIEPMVNTGTFEVYTEPDGWTVRTKDGGLSAHFEHTVAVTDAGPVILTVP